MVTWVLVGGPITRRCERDCMALFLLFGPAPEGDSCARHSAGDPSPPCRRPSGACVGAVVGLASGGDRVRKREATELSCVELEPTWTLGFALRQPEKKLWPSNRLLHRSRSIVYADLLLEWVCRSPRERVEVRRNRYKVAVDAEEGRRRREDNMVEIRKSRREESLQKKRREGMQAQPFPQPIQASAVEKKVIPLSHPSPSVLIPALRTVGNIVTGDDMQTQVLIRRIRSNLVIEVYLVSQGCIKPLCDLLLCPDPRIITVCLEGLENILKVGEAEKNLGVTGGTNPYAQLIEEAEGLDKIENFQSHDNTEIYEKSVKILETYWLEEEDDAMPGDTTQTAFDFGNNDQSVPSGGFNFG
ncbi:hypothetical protein B296_00007451 [Ensete ventricosum]|uniref:IBB domain-containing protein n=1 Tax=Ensete ventricosum TaxID=4639 RepID=A0A427B321_ENSVE|nr:hypothetical protein B296_00007451 [Ensete ventricosum]